MKSKKIIIFQRDDSNINPGGDTIQINEISRYLKQQGHTVHITNRLFIDISSYELAIIFNLTRYHEALVNVCACLKFRVAYILFPIYWDINKLKIPPYDLKSQIKFNMHPSIIDFIINYKNFIFNKDIKLYEKEINQYISLYSNKTKCIQFILDNALYICPNSIVELEHLCKYFKVKVAKCKIVYNGIQKNLYKMGINKEKREGIYCVGGIGPRKNQLLLAKACNNVKMGVNFVGKSHASNDKYFEKVKKFNRYSFFLGWKPYDEIMNILSNAKIHIQPSYIETPGLSSMEAYALGCRIIVSEVGPVYEYFGKNASYIDPYSLQSIMETLEIVSNENYKINWDEIKLFNDKFCWNNVLNSLNLLI
jgi:glycosyltransferase involved in cell wall biosynthesis